MSTQIFGAIANAETISATYIVNGDCWLNYPPAGQWKVCYPSVAAACWYADCGYRIWDANTASCIFSVPGFACSVLANASTVTRAVGSFYECPDATWALSGTVCTRPNCARGYSRDASGQCVLSAAFIPDPKNLGPPDYCAVGNPVNQGTGNKFQIEPDYAGEAAFPLLFQRYYNADPQAQGAALGASQRSTYERFIATNGTTTTVYRPDGKAYNFQLSNSNWVGDADGVDRLTQAGNWTYITADSTIEIYDATGKLLSVTDRRGLTQTLTYSDGTTGPNGGYVLDAQGDPTTTVLPAGPLIRVTDPSGRSLNFGYDASSRIVKMTDPANGVYLYQYDANNNLASVTYPDGKTKQYLYGEPAYTSGATLPHALTGIIDENGVRFATYWYDAQGRAINEQHAPDLNLGIDQYQLTYNTDTAGNPVSTIVTDPLGSQRTYNFTTILGVVKSTGVSQPGGSGCAAASLATTYDANGNIATRTDFNGNTTSYQYDLTRNLETSRTEAVGRPEARTITTQWHPTFRLPTQISEPGRVTNYTYDDTTGNVLTKAVTDTVSGATRTWTYTYTTSADSTLPGLLKTIDGPRTDVSDVTTYAYYANGDLKTVIDALGHTTQITQYDGNGRPLTILDPNGITITLSYTPRGWLASRAVAGRIINYTYDGVGQLIQVTQPDGSFMAYTYDAAHRLTDIADAAGDRLHYSLDAQGNRVQEQVFDPSGTLSSRKSRVFDALGRLWQEIGALNQTTTYAYDANGNLTSVIDPNNHTTVNVYDGLNRLAQVTDALSGVTQYGYGPLDQLASVTDPRGLTTSYAVSALGDTTQQSSPDSGVTSQSFDAAGNLSSRTDARGVSVNFTYDALNRLTQVSYPNAGENVSYIWDTAPGCSNGINRLCQVTDADGATTFTYDTYGNLVQETRSASGASFVTRYVYDPANRLIDVVAPTGDMVALGRDVAGRVADVSVTSAAAVTTPISQQIEYNGLGQVLTQTWGNGLVQTLGFDLSGQATSESFAAGPGSVGSGGAADADVPTLPEWAAILMGALLLVGSLRSRAPPRRLMQFAAFGLTLLLAQGFTLAHADNATLQYDPAGNVTQITTSQGTTTYRYDPLNRLQSEAGPGKTQSLTYDANGNRLSDGAGSYAYGTTSNRMQSRLGAAVTTDAAGNITSDGAGHNFVYNQAGRLYQVFQGSTLLATYSYDYQGRRTRKATTAAAPQGAQTVVYHYDWRGHLIGETTATGVPIRTYVWREDVPVAQVDYSPTRHILYLDVDHLNTPREARDATGKVVWRWESDAFGSTLPNEDPDGDGNKTTVNLRFPGQYYDQESGLSYNRNRTYDPAVGRYAESDPLGLIGGINTYAYVGANPLTRMDSLGLVVEDADYPAFGTYLIPRYLAGTYIHLEFADRVRALGTGYGANVVHDPTSGYLYRPDAFRSTTKRVWELKPRSYESGDKYDQAQEQLKKYCSGGYTAGNSRAFLKAFCGSSEQCEFSFTRAGRDFNVIITPDKDPASGLLFYEYEDYQSATSALPQPQAQPQTNPYGPPPWFRILWGL